MPNINYLLVIDINIEIGELCPNHSLRFCTGDPLTRRR